MRLGNFFSNPQTNRRLLIAAIFSQCVILVGMVGIAALPLWTGTEISVRTQPIDPRDLFRGNYARLSYAFSRIEHPVADLDAVRAGTVVYVRLRQNAAGLHELDELTFIKPESGVFLRGRVDDTDGDRINVRYGLEAFFAPPDEALALEERLRDRAVAVLAVSANGRARIKEIIAGN